MKTKEPRFSMKYGDTVSLTYERKALFTPKSRLAKPTRWERFVLNFIGMSIDFFDGYIYYYKVWRGRKYLLRVVNIQKVIEKQAQEVFMAGFNIRPTYSEQIDNEVGDINGVLSWYRFLKIVLVVGLVILIYILVR